MLGAFGPGNGGGGGECVCAAGVGGVAAVVVSRVARVAPRPPLLLHARAETAHFGAQKSPRDDFRLLRDSASFQFGIVFYEGLFCEDV